MRESDILYETPKGDFLVKKNARGDFEVYQRQLHEGVLLARQTDEPSGRAAGRFLRRQQADDRNSSGVPLPFRTVLSLERRRQAQAEKLAVCAERGRVDPR